VRHKAGRGWYAGKHEKGRHRDGGAQHGGGGKVPTCLGCGLASPPAAPTSSAPRSSRRRPIHTAGCPPRMSPPVRLPCCLPCCLSCLPGSPPAAHRQLLPPQHLPPSHPTSSIKSAPALAPSLAPAPRTPAAPGSSAPHSLAPSRPTLPIEPAPALAPSPAHLQLLALQHLRAEPRVLGLLL